VTVLHDARLFPTPLLWLALSLCLAGCRGDTVCLTGVPYYAFEFPVTDAITGENLVDPATKAVATSGQYVEELVDIGSQFRGVLEPGFYTLTVSRPGYRIWEKSKIWVTSGHCGVHRKRLMVELEPQ